MREQNNAIQEKDETQTLIENELGLKISIEIYNNLKEKPSRPEFNRYLKKIMLQKGRFPHSNDKSKIEQFYQLLHKSDAQTSVPPASPLEKIRGEANKKIVGQRHRQQLTPHQQEAPHQTEKQASKGRSIPKKDNFDAFNKKQAQQILEYLEPNTETLKIKTKKSGSKKAKPKRRGLGVNPFGSSSCFGDRKSAQSNKPSR